MILQNVPSVHVHHHNGLILGIGYLQLVAEILTPELGQILLKILRKYYYLSWEKYC